ncbi:MAG: hypothetical protein K6C08_11255 [Oscillospiraceae bacterium]|nr:hypothetical protein [Oscillospiraceae bacterium]
MNWDYLQVIPLLGLTAYFFYFTYYYAAPMFWLKVMLFYAHIRYRGIVILFTEGKISVTYTKDEAEHVIERLIEIDPTSRFLAMTVCSLFKGILRSIRRGTAAEEAPAPCALPDGERAPAAERRRAEKD